MTVKFETSSSVKRITNKSKIKLKCQKRNQTTTPILNIEATDEFACQLGKLDYRFSVNKPFVNGTLTSSLTAAVSGKEVAMTASFEKTAIQGHANLYALGQRIECFALLCWVLFGV